ncbi:MAG TPA: flagellar basal body rod protein FlgB [Anaerolineales bacterium]|nr:flagellar basal body rod protein FlgB [Anaerolineales bacterium]
MSDSLFGDRALRAARVALDGLSLRQQAISRNLANIDTPGYQAKTVNFEETMKHLLNRDPSLPLSITNEAHQVSAQQGMRFSLALRPGGSFRADQNNVDIDTEMTDMSETGIQYQAVSQAVSQKLLLLKTLAK